MEEDIIDGYIEGVHWIDKKSKLHIIKNMSTEYLENISKAFEKSNQYAETFKRNVKYVNIEIRNRKLEELLKEDKN